MFRSILDMKNAKDTQKNLKDTMAHFISLPQWNAAELIMIWKKKQNSPIENDV